ncbi:hypothetical protein [Yaniella flava]|uniref:hypothetical protein n=1 Tax=Yaniella flava TaxID=287930 RepID=UPI0031D3D1C7
MATSSLGTTDDAPTSAQTGTRPCTPGPPSLKLTGYMVSRYSPMHAWTTYQICDQELLAA